MIKEKQKEYFCWSCTFTFTRYKRFEESIDLILDDMGRRSKPNVTEKTLTLISDPLDEDKTTNIVS